MGSGSGSRFKYGSNEWKEAAERHRIPIASSRIELRLLISLAYGGNRNEGDGDKEEIEWDTHHTARGTQSKKKSLEVRRNVVVGMRAKHEAAALWKPSEGWNTRTAE